MFDFPNSPTLNQTTTAPNGAQFLWDGVKWTTALGSTAVEWLPLIGGTMQGPIVLSGNATQPLHAVPLQQVNSAVAGGPFLPLSGAQPMTGPLTLAANATQPLHAVPLQQAMTTAGGIVTGPLIYTATGGTTPRAAQDRAADVANVLDFGADPAGLADSTAAIRGAIATGRSVYMPKGVYLITDMLALNNGQLMYGDGRIATQINAVSTSFNLSALGIIQLVSGETGATLRDIGIYCIQPQTTVRASTVQFPPAIYAQNAGRFQLIRVRLSAVTVGLDARGNCGGAFIHDFEVGAFNTGMLWGGSFDGVHINNYRFWPFGIPTATNLYSVYSDGNTSAMVAGRVDGFTSKGFFSWLATVTIDCSATPGYGVFEFDDITLDGPTASLNMVNANRVLVNDFIPVLDGGLAVPSLVQTGGTLKIKTVWANTDATVPTWQISGGSLQVTAGTFVSSRLDTTAVAISGTAQVRFGSVLLAPGAGAHTAPFITQTGSGSSLRMDDCEFSAAATGVALVINNDNFLNHIGVGVLWNNMSFSLASALLPGPGASAVLGYYGPVIRGPVDYTSMQAGAYSFTALTTNTNRLTAFGAEALGKITPGSALEDTAFGSRAGRDLTTGVRNAFFGSEAGLTTTTGTDNTAVGQGAAQTQTTATRNTAIGSNALKFATGSGLTALGNNAGVAITTGAQNTVIGDRVAATNLQTGTGNILIGVDPTVDTPANSTSNFFGLGGAAVGPTFTAVGINTLTPQWSFLGSVTIPRLNTGSATGASIQSGTGAPGGTNPVGSLWLRTDGAVGSTLYVSRGGGTWNAVAGV